MGKLWPSVASKLRRDAGVAAVRDIKGPANTQLKMDSGSVGHASDVRSHLQRRPCKCMKGRPGRPQKTQVDKILEVIPIFIPRHRERERESWNYVRSD